MRFLGLIVLLCCLSACVDSQFVPSFAQTFELPVIGVASAFYQYAPTTAAQGFEGYQSWSFPPSGGIAARTSPWDPATNLVTFGNQYAFLQTGGSSPTTVSMSISMNGLTAGDQYGIAGLFAYRAQTADLTNAVFYMIVNGAQIYTSAGKGSGGGNLSPSAFTNQQSDVLFTAIGGGSDTLVIQLASNDGSDRALLMDDLIIF